MRLATPFDPIEVGEIDNFAFDFAADMGVTALEVRSPIDGSLQKRNGFFSVASIGGMPNSAAGGTYILEATAVLDDGRVLKLNAMVLCKALG